ncbi:MAG: transcriptional regulator [Ornithinibacter sp.]
MFLPVRYRDVTAHGTPSSLDVPSGPSEGVLALPITVHWGLDASTDLPTPDGVEKVCENLVLEGTAQQPEELLNADLLLSVWPHVRPPTRGRDLWQGRFLELAAP